MEMPDLEQLTREELLEGHTRLCIQIGNMETSKESLKEVRDKIEPDVYDRMVKQYDGIISLIKKDVHTYLDAIAFQKVR